MGPNDLEYNGRRWLWNCKHWKTLPKVWINTYTFLTPKITILLILRTEKARILFDIVETDAIKCLDKCLKYNRAQAPIFSDQAEFNELVAWAINITTDPVTKLLYSKVSSTLWLPIT